MRGREIGARRLPGIAWYCLVSAELALAAPLRWRGKDIDFHLLGPKIWGSEQRHSPAKRAGVLGAQLDIASSAQGTHTRLVAPLGLAQPAPG